MKCEFCGKGFFEDYRKYPKGEPRYCSVECSRKGGSSKNREERNKKIKESVIKTNDKKGITRKPKYCKICGRKLSYNNKSGFCAKCKSTKKTRAEIISDFRRKRKKELVEYKGGKCEICGYNKCLRALQFHHLDSAEKDFGLSSGDCKSWERDKEEVDKCILVCANCHAEIHQKIFEENKIGSVAGIIQS